MKCWHVIQVVLYGRSALDVAFDRSWCSKMCLHTANTLHKDKTRLVSPSWVTDWRRKTEVPVSTRNLSCQSILALSIPLKRLSSQKTGLLSGVWWSHSQLRKLQMYPWNVFGFFAVICLSLGHMHQGLAWTLIYFIDLLFRDFKNLILSKVSFHSGAYCLPTGIW